MSPWLARLPLMVLALVVLAVVLVDGVVGAVLPWVAVCGLMIFLYARALQARKLEQAAGRLEDMMVGRRHAEALRAAWRLLPKAALYGSLHLRCVATMGHCLDHLKAYEAALACYERLLGQIPEDHSAALEIQTKRALAALAADRLIDADDALRRLRGRVAASGRSPISAGYRLARLAQSVCTHHYDDAVAEADAMLDDLRPLGLEAGYGHALLALCYRKAPAADEQLRIAYEQACALWWHRARVLLPTSALVDRFPAVRCLVEAGA